MSVFEVNSLYDIRRGFCEKRKDVLYYEDHDKLHLKPIAEYGIIQYLQLKSPSEPQIGVCSILYLLSTLKHSK